MDTVTRNDLEDGILELSKSTSIPVENIRAYLHIYQRIKESGNGRHEIEAWRDLDRDFLKVLNKAVRRRWLDEVEGNILAQLWTHFMHKDRNFQRLSRKTLEDIITRNLDLEIDEPKAGRRVKPSVEFLLYALRKDAKAFGKRPHHEPISLFLSLLEGDEKYAVEVLKQKKPSPVIVNDTLSLCDCYFKAKGKSLLPDFIPEKPTGYLKSILQTLEVIPEDPPPEAPRIGPSLMSLFPPRR